MKFELSVPSKTFLLGEYLALKTGQALLVTTQPRFQLNVEMTKENQTVDFHADSPAGRLLKNTAFHFTTEFIDPHRSCGGFGRSSAEFLFALFLKDFKSILTKEASTPWTLQYVMKTFRKITKHYKTPPSGADIMAQFTGGVLATNLKQSECQQLDWFEDLAFSIYHTGKKVPTHKHLDELSEINCDEMKVIYETALKAIIDKDKAAFLQTITSYRTVLRMQGLEYEKTTTKLEKLLEDDDILAAKGCGALGADVILCFHDLDKSDAVKNLAESLGLTWISDVSDISKGFEFSRV